MVELWAGTAKDRLGAKRVSGAGGWKHPPKSWDLASTVRPRIYFFLFGHESPLCGEHAVSDQEFLSFFAACDAM